MADSRGTPSPADILLLWRAAEARLAELPERTPEWYRARFSVHVLRHEYQLAVRDRRDVADELSGSAAVPSSREVG